MRGVWLVVGGIGVILVLACSGSSPNSPDTTYSVAAEVTGLDYAPSDAIRVSNALALRLSSPQGSQELPLIGHSGTYPFAQSYSTRALLELRVQKQPDEYYCHRSDGFAAITAATTVLGLQCDYLGPDYFYFVWTADQVQLLGGGVSYEAPQADGLMYGLWTELRSSQDEFIAIYLSPRSTAKPAAEPLAASTVVIELPGNPSAGDRLALQPNSFQQGTGFAAGEAAVYFVEPDGTHSYATGYINIQGFAQLVLMRRRGQGSLALSLALDATLPTDAGTGSLHGELLLSATHDPARESGSFGLDDGRSCLFDYGQTLTIDPQGLACRGTERQDLYYRPVYTMALGCIAAPSEITGLSRPCIRTEDPACSGIGDYPSCE